MRIPPSIDTPEARLEKKTPVETPQAWSMMKAEKTRPTHRKPARKPCNQHGHTTYRHFGTSGLNKNSFLQKGCCHVQDLQTLPHAILDLVPPPENP